MFENISICFAILLVIGGYFFYYRFCKKYEAGDDLVVLPWLIFAILGAVDMVNIYLDAEKTWIGEIVGLLMFLGPASLTFLILKTKTSQDSYVKIITKEFLNEPLGTRYYISFAAILLALSVLVEFTRFGDTESWEWGLAHVTILMDISGILPLFSEAKNRNAIQITITWWLFTVASWIAWLLTEDSFLIISSWSIEGYLLIENIVAPIVLLGVIYYFRYFNSQRQTQWVCFFSLH